MPNGSNRDIRRDIREAEVSRGGSSSRSTTRRVTSQIPAKNGNRTVYARKSEASRTVNGRRRKSDGKGCVTVAFIVLCAALLVFAIYKFASGGETKNTANTANIEAEQTETTVKSREYNIPPASEENDLLKIARNAQGTEGVKICYLTFDDGPTKEVTPKVLDVLKKYDVKATFFCLGKMLDANRDIAEREHEEGHMLANHSYNHEYNKLYETQSSFMDEIERTQAVINEISGEDTLKLIRFPGGSYNAGDHAAEKQTYKQVLKDAGYYYVDWNCLNGDAESSLKDVSSLVSKVKNTATEDNIVVLMHDAAAKTTTPQALGEIIEYLKEKGYEFRRLDEVDYYDNGISSVKSGKKDSDSIIL